MAGIQGVKRCAKMACGGMVGAMGGYGCIPVIDGGQFRLTTQSFNGLDSACRCASCTAKEISNGDNGTNGGMMDHDLDWERKRSMQ